MLSRLAEVTTFGFVSREFPECDMERQEDVTHLSYTAEKVLPSLLTCLIGFSHLIGLQEKFKLFLCCSLLY